MNGLHAQHDDSLLWRVNQQEFSQRLRNRACVAYIRRRHDDDAAAVVAALLQRPQGAEQPCQVCAQVELCCASPIPCCGDDLREAHSMDQMSALTKLVQRSVD